MDSNQAKIIKKLQLRPQTNQQSIVNQAITAKIPFMEQSNHRLIIYNEDYGKILSN